MVDLLLKNGAKVNAMDKEKNTPLHLAGTVHDKTKQQDITKLLLGAGADRNLKNDRNQTPAI